ncbi:MAG: hypothetical protein CBC84_002860 [Pelagibacteraceae bacterium TMED124]|nr:MAG: hypothetical protein CBC84_002860 [Pelagibacteraceae bacterium TMED124]|tara:strand:- start:2457 stop:3071 length:615 start_codon:yes stop_codon:yes gene_type:complete
MNDEFPEKKFLSFIKSNSKIFTYTLSTFFIVMAALFWMSYDSNKEKKIISEDFIKAKIFLEKQNKDKATLILKNIIEKKDTIYSSLSLFLLIDQNLVEDKQLILEYFDNIISDGDYSEEDKNLLKLKKAIYISDIEDEQEMLKLLNPIINSDSVWKNQSLKFLGDFYYSISQLEKARQYYSTLLKEEINNVLRTEINSRIKSIK